MKNRRTGKPRLTPWNPPDAAQYLANLKRLHGSKLSLKTDKPAKDSPKQGGN